MKKVYAEVSERIQEKMKAEGLFWRKPWRINEKRPVNGASNRPYTGMNSMLLRGKFNDHRWYTARHLKQEGIRWEGKGEMIYGWFCTMRSYKPKKHDENGKELKWPSMGLRYWYVWNHEQTDLPQTENQVETVEFQPIEKAQSILDRYVEREGIELKHEGARAYYSPLADRVVLPSHETFFSNDHYYATAFHEIGHSTGHEKRLKRDLTNVFGDHKYSFEELVAEMTSCYLSHECHIANADIMDNSVAYLQHWSKQLKEAPDKFIIACTRAEKATNFILQD